MVVVRPRPRHVAGHVFAILLAVAGSAMAEEGSPNVITPGQIRAHYDTQRPSWIKVPPVFRTALIAGEDRDFLEHPPHLSGITQYLAFWGYDRDLGKAQRAALPFVIGSALSHEDILTWYGNEVYFGRNCYGLSGAAGAFFGKTAKDLSLAEAALLAGLIKGPSRLEPTRHPDRALQRRNAVLEEMERGGFISPDERRTASLTPLVVGDVPPGCAPRK